MAKFDDFDLDVMKTAAEDGGVQLRITSISLCTSSCKTALLGGCPILSITCGKNVPNK